MSGEHGDSLDPPQTSGPSRDAVTRELEKILSSGLFVPARQLCRFYRGAGGRRQRRRTQGVQPRRRSFPQRRLVRSPGRQRRPHGSAAAAPENYGILPGRGRERCRRNYPPKGQLSSPFSVARGDPTKGRHSQVFQGPSQVKIVDRRGRNGRNSRNWGHCDFYWPHTSNLPAIAVLPLENLSADPEQEYFSEGITDSLITNLAKIRALRVISRTSVLRFRHAKVPITEIAKQLGVQYVVEGTVTRAAERVRITAQLIGIPNERHIWAESYERSGKDVLALQGEIAQTIATQVNVHVTPQEKVRLSHAAISPVAHDLYLKGMFNWHTRNPERLQQALELFREAIRREPSYAAAYVGLADSYGVLSGQAEDPVRANELLAVGRDAARKAVELDDSLGEAHVSLVVNENSWDWAKMEREFRRALDLSPGYAFGHTWFGWVLCKTGRSAEGLAEIRRGLELDPLSPSPNMTLGAALIAARRYDEAIRQLRQTIEVFPGYSDPYQLLGMCYMFQGRNKEAIEVLEQAVKLSGGAPRVVTLLAYIRAVAGDPAECRRLLAELHGRPGVQPVSFALLYMGLNDKDHAFEELQKGVEQYSTYIDQLKVQPLFDSLHGDPRYLALLRRMNLN